MRNIWSIFIFVLFFGKALSQLPYVPMPMQNCYWTISHNAQCYWLSGYGASVETYTIYPSTDTIINSIRYVKFYLTDHDSLVNGGCSNDTRNAGYWGGVRQDTANQKIYWKPPGNGNETLYYNFNYNVGDTMKGVYFGYGGAYGQCRIINSIYYQNFNDGVCRRVYTFKYSCNYSFNGYSYSFYDKLIEGCGMSTGFDNTMTNSSFNSNVQETYTNAMFVNAQKVQMATSTNTCPVYDVGILENTLQNNIKIFPNPVSGFITVECVNSDNIDLFLYDVLGNEISISNELKIQVDHLSSGTYFLKCVDRVSGEAAVKKVIKY
jgi:hypothetical protein